MAKTALEQLGRLSGSILTLSDDKTPEEWISVNFTEILTCAQRVFEK